MPPRAARQRVHTGGRRLTIDLGAVGRPQALAHCTIWLAPLCGECADRGHQSSTNHPIIIQSSTNHQPITPLAISAAITSLRCRLAPGLVQTPMSGIPVMDTPVYERLSRLRGRGRRGSARLNSLRKLAHGSALHGSALHDLTHPACPSQTESEI
eukprot:CAMPEP_0181210370 /NCGR_PEP_ID=MMETSP1096-20121128/23190_1 /TAXON_ID=156174 ORGANISM="Chrysochromulina ericina, Strain CCMP281" /NCGR_SAMPLE_ID=MMETSP1096 /ASSEMBLY_ACC=CAM_ASM_000453 /LENGTH=154 /DNA_ID=CAMNT_0023301647 /DNA_START=192 /DNA_END=656 /DNA_ORIENTATION=-